MPESLSGTPKDLPIQNCTNLYSRIGVEIGLHRKTVLSFSEKMEPSIRQSYSKEVLARERTWFCVFVLDRSMSAQTGKPPQAPVSIGMVSRGNFADIPPGNILVSCSNKLKTTTETSQSIREVDNWWHEPGSLLSDVFVSAIA